LFDIFKKEEEVLVGWNVHPMFLKDTLNFGSFEIPLLDPKEPISAPPKNKKPKTITMTVTFDLQEWIQPV